MSEIRTLTRNSEVFYPLTHVDAIVSNTGSGADDKPILNSENLVKSGGVFDSDSKATMGSMLRIGTRFNADETVIYEDSGKIIIKQPSAVNRAFGVGFAPIKDTRYKIRLVAKCESGEQEICVGVFSSVANVGGVFLKIDETEKEYFVNLVSLSSTSHIGVGILASKYVANNTVTISAYDYFPITTPGDVEDTPLISSIGLSFINAYYISTEGQISQATTNYYHVSKFYINTTSWYWITMPHGGSGASLCEYTDSTYSTLKRIVIGHLGWNVSVNQHIHLTSGYYGLSFYYSAENYLFTVAHVYKLNFNCDLKRYSPTLPVSTQAVGDTMKTMLEGGDILDLVTEANFNTEAVQDENGITIPIVDNINQGCCLRFCPIPNTRVSLTIKARCTTGTQRVCVGLFSSSSSDEKYRSFIKVTTEEKTFNVNFIAATDNVEYSIGISIFASDINELKDVIISKCWFNPVNNPAISFNTESFLQSVSRNDKPLIKIACAGDSLIANAVGGSIPSGIDEGDKRRPIRMDTNNIPRRLYDYISWNKPVWRRLDDSDWTKSGFSVASWSSNYTVFEGMQVPYQTTSTQGSYCQITVPQGYEHFALVVRNKSGNGKINVTINNSQPSTITYVNPVLLNNPGISQADLIQMLNNNTTVNASKCPINIPCGPNQIDLNKGVSATGNPYAIVEFNYLPSGQANTLKFTSNDSSPVDIWGGFYWSGTTAVIMNIAHGGHDTLMLINQHLDDELYNAGYDSVLFEIPEMNNTRLSLEQTEKDLYQIISTLNTIGIDRCFTSCNLLGLSIKYDVNFYMTDAYGNAYTPHQKEINNLVRGILYKEGEAFIDIFQYFQWHTENKGGTLEGGEAGLWYSWDGQHPNKEGCEIWTNCIKDVIENKPIKLNN